MLVVIKNDVVIKTCSTVDEAKKLINEDLESDRLMLCLKRRLLKKLIKKDCMPSLSGYKVAEVVENV